MDKIFKRVIPVLLLQNDVIVRSEGFKSFKPFGNPIDQLNRLSEWDADELVYIDITRSGNYDPRRLEIKHTISGGFLSIVQYIAKHACMPLTFGGKIRNIEQVDKLIENGADKVLINTGCIVNPKLVTQVANKYGSQAMVAGIDITEDGYIHSHQNKAVYPMKCDEWAKRLEGYGAGEIIINSISRDGKGTGYDVENCKKVADSVKIPVVALGGCGDWEHMVPILDSECSAVAAGNIFNFKELSYPDCKNHLRKRGCNVR